ncbi:MAG: thiamine pyrophosphate-dependent dehydrogenase E1 component subunit alpha [Chloroflexi bacterium]|nr:thiamine pyrophosphate-dependent dehydrogenase E1 component subunit alpha [Chloroflexota bacterium]
MAQERLPTRTRAEAAPHDLTDAQLLDLYTLMALSRAIDERMWLLQRQGKIPFAVTGQGHEAAQVGSAFALRPGEDWVLPYYRDLGVVLTLGMTAREVLLDAFARADGPSSGGRQMPAHYACRRLNIVSVSSPVATQLPQATGVALASKLKGERAVTVCYFGDGATSKGDFHEALNFAAIHRLPVIFFCENNGWAISVPVSKQMPVAHVVERARAYNMPGELVDGTDVLAVYERTRAAVARARAGDGPTLIEARVYRLTAHTSDDDDRRYRSEAERAEARQHDPLPRFERVLRARGVLNDALLAALQARIAREVAEAVALAEAAPLPAPADALRHVYAA